jgi:hypothetical protein
VGRVEGAVAEGVCQAPCAAGKDLLRGLSAGEVGVGSGGSGVSGAGEEERETGGRREAKGAPGGQAFPLAFSIVFRIWSQLPPVTAPANFPFAS